MDWHVMGFRKKKFICYAPLGVCPLGFSKRPIGSKIAVLASRKNSEFGITANSFFWSDRLTGELMASAPEWAIEWRKMHLPSWSIEQTAPKRLIGKKLEPWPKKVSLDALGGLGRVVPGIGLCIRYIRLFLFSNSKWPKSPYKIGHF